MKLEKLPNLNYFNMKYCIFLVFLFLVYSCDIQYDGDTRLIIDTTVKDMEDGTPLQNIPYQVIVTNGYTTETISSGTTDNQGRLLSIFPAPTLDTDFIQLRIEPQNTYKKQEFIRIQKSDFIDYKISPFSNGLAKIDNLVELTLEINQITTQTFLSELSIDAIKPDLTINYNPENDEDIYNPYYYQPILLFKNQTFNLKYKVRNFNVNPPSETYYTIPLVIENENLNYEINY
jgi:5-hydroxyisourate hydrolase-like protein (transthyretin family)